MKTAVLLSLIAGAAAFAPAQKQAPSTVLNMAFENELGVQQPVRTPRYNGRSNFLLPVPVPDTRQRIGPQTNEFYAFSCAFSWATGIPSVSLPMATKRSLTAFATLNSSTDESACLPLLDTL